MLKYLVIVCVIPMSIASNFYHSNMMSCPSIKSQSIADISQMMGEWKLVLLLMDDGFEDYEDDSSCVQANFKKVNNTSFKQMWYINSKHFGYGAIAELPTRIMSSGEWIITDPLGGELLVKVLHAFPKSHMTLTFCGTQNEESVHLWTIVATRKAKISQINYLELSAELLSQGFNVKNSKMITWIKC